MWMYFMKWYYNLVLSVLDTVWGFHASATLLYQLATRGLTFIRSHDPKHTSNITHSIDQLWFLGRHHVAIWCSKSPKSARIAAISTMWAISVEPHHHSTLRVRKGTKMYRIIISFHEIHPYSIAKCMKLYYHLLKYIHIL